MSRPVDTHSDSSQPQDIADREDRAVNAFIANYIHQLSERHAESPPPKA